MKYLGVALFILGILLVLGAAGSSDSGLVSFDRVIIQVAIGLVMICGGVVLMRIAQELEYVNKRKERKNEHNHN